MHIAPNPGRNCGMAPPCKYDPEVADNICLLISGGLTLKEVCRMKGMPPESTVRTWGYQDIDGFAKKLEIARALMAHSLAEESVLLARSTTKVTYFRNRLQFDVVRWYVSKVLPKVYGDKQFLEHSVNEDTVALIMAARKRFAAEGVATG